LTIAGCQCIHGTWNKFHTESIALGHGHKAGKETLQQGGRISSNSEARFRALVEVTSDWIWAVDKNAVYIYSSPKVRELLGYEPEE